MSEPLAVLPNGMRVAEINSHETAFLYDEIFIQNVYGAYQLDVPTGGLVLDIGANIGLFAIYILERFATAKVWTFEPIPNCLSCLHTNLMPYGKRARIFPIALGEADGEAEFSFYPNYSIISGMFADVEQDLAVLRAGARTQYLEKYKADPSERELEFLVGSKLNDRQIIRCPVKSLSTLLAEEKVSRIALAKIDVERAENVILTGIKDEDWPRFDQLVIEVHDQGNNEHELMAQKLNSHGFHTDLFVEPKLKNSGIYVLSARR